MVTWKKRKTNDERYSKSSKIQEIFRTTFPFFFVIQILKYRKKKHESSLEYAIEIFDSIISVRNVSNVGEMELLQYFVKMAMFQRSLPALRKVKRYYVHETEI